MVAIVIGRELFMTVFRQIAARRGVVIAAIGPAKWKTGFQSIWVGAAYFWFFAATLAARIAAGTTPRGSRSRGSMESSDVVTMVGAVFLTCIHSGLYFARYGRVITG